MKQVIVYAPNPGTSQDIILPLQTGTTEVINDSNHLLIVGTNTGTTYQIPGVAMLYPTPNQGGAFTIYCVEEITNIYLSAGLGSSDNVVVNQYLPGEVAGESWPYAISRSDVLVNNIQIYASGTAANLASGLSVTLAANVLTITDQAGFLYLYGADISVDQESTAHSYTIAITLLAGGATFDYVFHSKTASDTQFQLRYPPGLQSQVQGDQASINVDIPAVSGSTARCSINLMGYYK